LGANKKIGDGSMNDYPKYTNLELEINFVNEKSQEIINDIAEVLKKHGWTEFSQEMGMDESGVYFRDKVVFFPEYCR
jgi:hypothetical protein